MNRSLVDILNIIGIIIVIAVVAFAVYSLFVDKPFYRASSYWADDGGTTMGSEEDSGTYSTDKPVDEIDVKNISGRIEARGWNEDYVKLDYIKRGPGRPPEVKIDFEGSRLVIAAVYPKAPGNFGSVDFSLSVPENLDSFKAGSVSGRIEISGLDDKISQKLSSTSGAVSTDSSGNLNISSVSGSLTFSSSGEDVKASTTSGRITGELKNSSPDGKVDISSVSGRVVLEVPSELSADVNLHSVSGSVSSELPVSVTSSKRNTIRGKIGNGGSELEISTVSGSIKITK